MAAHYEAAMLEGIKIVELATWVAGPSAAAVMADWGANVIKVEGSGGDPVRGLFAEVPEIAGNPVFEFENRGKRSIVLNVSKPEGRAALLRLLADADIFVTNLRPGSLKRARLDFDSIHGELPRLIYCSVSGYGLEGDAVDLPAFDIAALWTRSGMAGAVIPEGIEPFPCRPGMGDSICALAVIASGLAALTERARTGKGRLVETSLMRTGIYAMGWDMSIQLKTGQLNTARQRKDALAPTSNYFRTADDRWFCVLPRAADDWKAVLTAADQAHLIDDPRFATRQSRTDNGRALVEALDAGFAKLTLAEVAARLTASDAIWAPLQKPADIARDPYAHAAGCFVEVEDASGERFLAPASPARFPGADDGPKRPAPLLGQHTREILREAGYPDEQIETLLETGIAVQK
jgi:crotonobetainyl-CoA:carnitine CoA-transferase CaiB-like acyl-CoA transferase